MLQTTNLKLKKPEGTDVVNIDDFNSNADILDAEVQALKNGKSPTGHTHTKSNITDFAHTHAMSDITGLNLTATNVNITDSNNYFTSTNVEGALSELFLNADNGKKTIATAIGSPLVNADTFSAMGTKIDTLTSTFKANLNAKGITTVAGDKMSILIDKVNKLKVIKTPVVAGDNFLIYTSDVSSEYNYSVYTNIFTHKVAFSDGSYRVKCSFNTTSNSWVTYIKIIHSRNGNIIFSQEFSRNITTPLIATLDIQNVVMGDNIEIECKKSSSSSEGKVKINSISVGFNAEIL